MTITKVARHYCLYLKPALTEHEQKNPVPQWAEPDLLRAVLKISALQPALYLLFLHHR